jgi:hypothetical protein
MTNIKRMTRMAMFQATLGMMAGTTSAERGGQDVSVAPSREYHPWDDVQLTKAERKGKGFDELQALRREKWEAGRSL